MSFFKSTFVAALAASGAMAAGPSRIQRRDNHDIVVQLTSVDGSPVNIIGFNKDLEVSKYVETGYFTHVELILSDRVKDDFRCSISDVNGNRIITTRGDSVDFTFGDGGKGPWALKNGPFSYPTITCSPAFEKFNDDINQISVRLVGDNDLKQRLDFSVDEVTGRAATRTVGGGAEFRTVQLVLGPNVDNQALRCQAIGPDGAVVLVDRGANVNKLTFGDAGKGAWTFDVARDGIAAIETVTCDPTFA
jgi:hypothetical protein